MSDEKEWVDFGEVPHRDRISFSEWALFRNGCQMRWKLDYLDNNRSNDTSLALMFGTAMHATLEELLHPDPDKRVSLEQAKLLWRARLDVVFEELTDKGYADYGPFGEGDDVGKGGLMHPAQHALVGERILEDILRVPEFTECRVVKFEYKIEDQLERTDSPIGFKGFVDFMATIKNKRGQTVLLIKDFKTCKWGWPYQKQQDPDVLAQPRLYKHFVCKQTGMDPKMVRTGFTLLKKTPRKGDIAVEDIKVPSSENDLKRTIARLQEDITRMRSGRYEKNRESCVKPWGICPYYNSDKCTGTIPEKPTKIRKKP